MGVETFWVSDIHPGEPDEYGKSILLDVVRASDYDALRAERDGLLSARDDLAASNERLQAEIERLTWNERTYFAEAERLRAENAALWAENEAKAQGLREALADLAASEANLAALQARWDARPVAEFTDVYGNSLRVSDSCTDCGCARGQHDHGTGLCGVAGCACDGYVPYEGQT